MKILAKRRRIAGKTNYTKRRRLLEGRKPRIVVRKTNRYIIIQLVESKFAQDKIEYSVTSKKLTDYGWPEKNIGSLKSLGAAYLTGLLFGLKLKNLNLKDAPNIIDTGLIRNTKGSKIYAALKGIIDSGIEISCDPEVIPDAKRIENENISDFFSKVKENITKNMGAIKNEK